MGGMSYLHVGRTRNGLRLPAPSGTPYSLRAVQWPASSCTVSGRCVRSSVRGWRGQATRAELHGGLDVREHVHARLEAPAGGSPHVDVLVAPLILDGGRLPADADGQQVRPAGGTVAGGLDLVVHR